jgi:hypothetical protein
MGEKVRKFRVVVWGEAPDTPEERKVISSPLLIIYLFNLFFKIVEWKAEYMVHLLTSSLLAFAKNRLFHSRMSPEQL